MALVPAANVSPVPPSPDRFRLGVHPVDGGVTVAVFAAHASAVEFCLFKDDAETRVTLNGPVHGVWHGFVAGIEVGQRYGFRASGPWAPRRGHRYNPAKLLIDPYGRGLDGHLAPMTAPGASALRSNRDGTDTAPFTPRSVVVADPGTGFEHPKPRTPWRDTVLYEAHVKGFTKLMPGIPEELRGTYAGLAHPASVEHLTALGVTAVELLPVQAFASEPHLEGLGLSNYWGYSTMNFFSPHAPYATQAARAAGPEAVRDEFRGMVDLLHAAGIEVILDVVYNHTMEGGWGDRVVSWRGLENFVYYRHSAMNPQHYDDVTGTGNSLDFSQPAVIKMTLDSLRYWTDVMGVDGFRFDLAATLGRNMSGFSTDHPFLVALTTDPLLGSTKLIAEPWDVGLGGWQVGNFPMPMTEWNDRFRDYVRSYWLTFGAGKEGGRDHATAPELATRLAGSADLFGHTEPYGMRGPMASINFITAHDGFTAYDLTAYNDKHNEANGEHNRDGTDNNRSYNHGAEGPTDDVEVLAARRRSLRNLLGTLLLSAGTPMLLGGDEMGRTQHGSNNAYCQDNEISWLDWERQPWQFDLQATVAHLIGLRKRHLVLRPERFYDGVDIDPRDQDLRADSAWFTVSGEHEDEDWWDDPATRVVQFMRSLSQPDEADALIVVNGSREGASVTIPDDDGTLWNLAWDSAWESPAEHTEDLVAPGSVAEMPALTMRLYISAV
ncbi:glycogen debranching protein GlgX [Demequina sp.]|uniref:glycogen debranching protein GlgX n=1 Tax=Demequina sp. TaxID=2050685 RepID=UPI0025BC2DDE|nr:glycogen debranching protein GlgX [Demequina sp.]